MKSKISILILVSFVCISAFGFLAMGHGLNFFNGGCVASVLEEAPCPHSDPLAFYSFHIEMFKKFVSVIVDEAVSSLLVAVLILIVLAAIVAFGKQSIEPIVRYSLFSRWCILFKERYFQWQRYFLHWLNTLNNILSRATAGA